ncbi:MAG: GIY-YIG nuclease family protein [Fischerella sp.]|uniref:GIY-YIG nuclease family protein n=1 Tax=Fischerella sp. TaxID=1191 RepID=UPI0017E09A92|nr:GIY-YIG nuclease family protein [Fischerella sp.]NWF61739.1 GIY-YIG nuclease family protein [Fischerella sp.]
MPLEHNQLNLFSDLTLTPARRAETLVMSHNALVQWKSQIFDYQQRVRQSKPPEQTVLFDLAPNHCDPDQIDPLQLEVRSLSFWRMPADSPGDSCLYFVVDNAAHLILYIGETCRSNKRWKGIHDCKDYIASYQDLHYQYGLKTAVNIAFWWDAPTQRKARQQLEQALIQRWKSPFNKELWGLWARPFG